MAVLTGRSNVLKSRISDVSPRTATVSRATGDVGQSGRVGGDERCFPRFLFAAGCARVVGQQLDVAFQLRVRRRDGGGLVGPPFDRDDFAVSVDRVQRLVNLRGAV